MTEQIEGWEVDENGDPVLRGFAGFQFLILSDRKIALRLEFVQHGDQPKKPSGFVQLEISRAEAQIFAGHFATALREVERKRSTKN